MTLAVLKLQEMLHYNDVEGRGYGSANGEKGGSSSRERPPYESGRGSRRRGVYFFII